MDEPSIFAALQRHGAAPVLRAVRSAIAGNRVELLRMGIIVVTLSDAARVAAMAIEQLEFPKRPAAIADLAIRMAQARARRTSLRQMRRSDAG
jgi:hypothetical protein